MALTGKFNFRKALFGALILEVEEEVKPLIFGRGKLKKRWRRANLMDLAEPEMRRLMDMRFQPLLGAPPPFRSAASAPASADRVPLGVAALRAPAAETSVHQMTH